jgi:hypothetical protein
MHRCYFYLLAFISITTAPFSALAEMAVDPVTADTQSRYWTRTANDAGFYIDLPAVNYNQLIGQIRIVLTSLTHRQEEITRYLDENQLDAKDALITAIMPGGLLYAAVRKGNLELAKAELTEITEAMAELSRDLLAMQVEARELTVAQLH